MGDLLDKLKSSAEKAKEDNKLAEKELDKLVKTREYLEQEIKDLTNRETKH